MIEAEAPALRRDAARNRARILHAAAQVFADRGPGADVREIARAAEVGMGTLYRHFPTKEALLDAAIYQDVIEWTDAARDAVTTDAWGDLRRFMDDALTRHAAHRALLEGFGTSLGDTPNVHACRLRIRPIIEALVARAQAAGALRPDVTAVDIHLQLIAIGRIVPLGEHAWRRQLDIVLDGLSSPAPSTIETSPMPYDDLHASIAPGDGHYDSTCTLAALRKPASIT